ncbi:hypothetical protein [Novosphingobium huizhouense]|uniref:hypothetical protein n=1 Tax=Novosphingobium huizhouense TaxID=2866625 RepID=UPI001CD863F1|nr:hypothetical protein [Novosphingobium huizhouense]
MDNISHLNLREPMFAPCAPHVEQERARSALFTLRDLLEAAPPAVAFDPEGLGALIGMVGDMLPVLPEDGG